MLENAQEAPGPKGHWLLGSLRERRQSATQLYLDSVRDYGPVVKFRFGPIKAYLICHPDHVRYVLLENNKNYVKGFGYTKMKAFFGESLITSDGEFWVRQRKLAQPAFHPSRIAGFAGMMVKESLAFIERWRGRSENGEPVDFIPEMNYLTL